MVAGCLRRVGRLEEALLAYRAIYASHPANLECLRYLVQLSQASGAWMSVAARALVGGTVLGAGCHCYFGESADRGALGLNAAPDAARALSGAGV